MNMIIMLTKNDKTVSKSLDIFDDCKQLPVKYWGFKNIGLPVPDMKKLVYNMKQSNKNTCLEVVTYDEVSSLEAAQLALECKFDYLMGTTYYESVHKVLESGNIKYFPFCGNVDGSPSVLRGSIQEIIDSARKMEQKGVDGLDLLTYRYVGDAEELAAQFVRSIKIPVILAGSINNYERLEKVKNIAPWGFTIGTALFDKKFGEGKSFKEQLNSVISYLGK